MINPINNYNNLKITSEITEKSVAKNTDKHLSDFEKILEKAVGEKDEKKLKEACKDFESVFVNMMFSQMKKTVQKTNLFGESYAESMYDDMLVEKYSEEMSKGKGIGLADIMYKQLSKGMNNK